jgi:lysophospholipase L1-like esterase
MMRRLILFAVQGVAIAAITLALLEAIVLFSLRYPAASVIPMPVLRPLHELFDRNTIQVMPECAQYDETLTYTLRPGGCTFANREFSTKYAINSLGLRDDEQSLDAPRVVMLGDSVTMGWGVEQDEAFPSVFERQTGWRTLNAGISSYGTVRELRLLARLDRRRLEHIVIQYSGNDFRENEQLVSGAFKILTREGYEQTVQQQADLIRYYPGKYAINLLVMLRNSARSQGEAGQHPSPQREAEVFLEVMSRSPVDLTGYAVTVFSLEPAFIAALRPLVAASGAPLIQRLRLVDGGGIESTPGTFLVLDVHPTSLGQEAIGRALAKAITQAN